MEKVNKFVCLGNISSGKSTVVDWIAENVPGGAKVSEPVKKWIDCGFLGSFYENQRKYAFPFQQFAFATRMELYKSIPWETCEYLIADAHVISDRYCFAEQLKENGHISEQELGWYGITFDGWQRIVPEADPSLYIYLRTTPEVCFERKDVRRRKEESQIPLAYFHGLHDHFEALIQRPEVASKLVIVDASRPKEAVFADVKEIIESRCSPVD